MPLDYRRFNGPEDSKPYRQFSRDYSKTFDEQLSELIDENGVRKDGRATNEPRIFYSRTDLVSQAKGSAYIEHKRTKVACSVFDPREIMHHNEYSSLGQIFCEVKFAPFSCPRKRRPHAPDAEEKALAVALCKALQPAVCRHKFPNFQIDVLVYILEHDGSCLAAAINAAGLALADAAVPMYDIITASSIAIIDDKILVDPTESEEYLAIMNNDSDINHGVITMSRLPTLKQIADFRQIGSMDFDCVTAGLEVLEWECGRIVPYIQQVLVLKVKHSMKLKKKLEEEAEEREAALNKKMEEWKLLLS